MKKSLLIAAAALLASNIALFGQIVNVTSPNGGESWAMGSAQTITWNHSGVGGNVRIDLLNAAGGVVGLIARVPVSDSSYPWTVGELTTGTVPAGEYRIGLYVRNEDVGDSSDAVFSINREATPPASRITVTAPNDGESWALGSAQTINWTHSGVSGNVRIDLLNPAGGVIGLIAGVPVAGGSYPWTVGEMATGTAPVGEYRIGLYVSNEDASDSSNAVFSINREATLPTSRITVTAPNARSSWRPGSRQTITWTKSGTLNPMANITLRREETRETVAARIADGCANNGSRVWFIPASLAEGRYFVRVKSGRVQGDSAVFAIGASGAGSELPGPDTPIRTELEIPGVGVEYYNGHIVAWVKNNGPDSLRDHDVKFRLNFPEEQGGEQIITKRITVPVGSEKGVELLAMSKDEIPDTGLRTSISIDTSASHISDSNRLNQHRDVRLYADTRTPIDLAIAISNQRVSQVIAGGDLNEGIPHHKYRLRATLHLRNNSSAPAEITRVSCRWKEQYHTDSGWTHNPETHAHGTLTLGPFRPGEDITREIELEYKTYTFKMERRIHFELDPDRLLNDPNRGNNEVGSVTYDVR